MPITTAELKAEIQTGPLAHRTTARWEECGIQFCSQTLEKVGGEIDLHRHSYDHIAICTQGWFDCVIEKPDGSTESFQVASKDHRTNDSAFDPSGYKILIPAMHQHTFVLREGFGEILCIWGTGTDQ